MSSSFKTCKSLEKNEKSKKKLLMFSNLKKKTIFGGNRRHDTQHIHIQHNDS